MSKQHTPQLTMLELTVKDRLVLATILPKRAGLATIILVDSVIGKIKITPEEIDLLSMKDTTTGGTVWNVEKETVLNVAFTKAEIEVLNEGIKQADEQKVITLDHLPLIKKIQAV